MARALPMRAIASAAVSAMKSPSLDLLTWRIPGMTAYEAFIPGSSTRNRNGHISGARLESGTMTTESEPFVLDGIRNDDPGTDLSELGWTGCLQVDPVGASALHRRLRLAGRVRSAFVHSSSQARSSGVSRRNAA